MKNPEKNSKSFLQTVLKLVNIGYRALILMLLTYAVYQLFREYLDTNHPKYFDGFFAFLWAGWFCISTDLRDWFLGETEEW